MSILKYLYKRNGNCLPKDLYMTVQDHPFPSRGESLNKLWEIKKWNTTQERKVLNY